MSQISFRYKAIDHRGAKTKGVLRAATANEAYRRISAAGLKPLKLTAQRSGRIGGRSATVGTRDLAHLTYQFGVLMEARIPIADGLRSISEQETNPKLRAVIEEVAGQIEAGNSVTDSLNQHRDVFGEVYIETIRAAETSGNMVKVLARLAEMLERQYESNKNIKGAMIYPACVVIAMVLAVTFLLIFVVPQFARLYSSRGFDLPLPTQILIGASSVVRSYWHVLIAGGAGIVWGIRRLWRAPTQKYRIDGWLHKIPVLRDLLRGVAVSRFAHLFGVTLQSGLGLIEALELSGTASGRPLLQADVQKMRDQVKQGGRLADVMLACAYLPGFARRMIAAGEEAAEMPKMCEIVARHYDSEVGHLTKNLPTILEPIMIVGLAGVFLVVALAIFLPMWEMGTLMG